MIYILQDLQQKVFKKNSFLNFLRFFFVLVSAISLSITTNREITVPCNEI